MKASKSIRATAVALLCVICTACNYVPEGRYLVVGKEIRGRLYTERMLVVKNPKGVCYPMEAGLNEYYSISVGDTVSVSLGEIVGVHRKQEPEATTE